MYEVEQKYRLDDPADFQQRVSELGATWGEGIEQIDHYFAHPCRDFAQTDEALRIRQIDQNNFVTYKGPKIDLTTKTRQELELPLSRGPDFANEFAELLTLLGFKFVAAVRKIRRSAAVTWQGGSVEVVLDRVDGVGAYAELEVMAEEVDLAIAKQRLASLGTKLNLTSVERSSYLELLLEGK